MRRICAWCRQPLNDEAEDENPVIHGMCDSCLENALLNLTSSDRAIDLWHSPGGARSPRTGTGRAAWRRADRASLFARAGAAPREQAQDPGDVSPAQGS